MGIDMGWGELLVVAIVAVVFVKPKDLIPTLHVLLRRLYVLKSMIRDMQALLWDVLREDGGEDDAERRARIVGPLPKTSARERSAFTRGGKEDESVMTGTTGSGARMAASTDSREVAEEGMRVLPEQAVSPADAIIGSKQVQE